MDNIRRKCRSLLAWRRGCAGLGQLYRRTRSRTRTPKTASRRGSTWWRILKTKNLEDTQGVRSYFSLVVLSRTVKSAGPGPVCTLGRLGHIGFKISFYDSWISNECTHFSMKISPASLAHSHIHSVTLHMPSTRLMVIALKFCLLVCWLVNESQNQNKFCACNSCSNLLILRLHLWNWMYWIARIF